MRIDKNTTFKDFVFYTNLFKIEESQIESLFKKLEKKGHPQSVFKKIVPENLNDLTLEQLVKIESIKIVEDMMFVPLQVILDIDKLDVLKCKAFDVIRFSLFVKNELVRMGKLFSEIKYKPSAEEIQAGINQIDNGIFGTMDWYAKRMGIIDHDYVGDVKWWIVYNCMKIDNTNAMFEKKLHEIYSKKKK